MYLLLISEILALFVSILPADQKYSLCNRENLQQSIKSSYLRNKIRFSEYFALFLKSASNFEHFQTADDPHSLRISEIISCQKCG